MAEMGNYCKGYELKDLRAYPHWTENAGNARKERKEENGKETEVLVTLADDSIVYLQENYVVTHDIFKDENILFDAVTDDWKNFCHGPLGFEIPVYEPIEIPTAG
jgi:hypothetical protein